MGSEETTPVIKCRNYPSMACMLNARTYTLQTATVVFDKHAIHLPLDALDAILARVDYAKLDDINKDYFDALLKMINCDPD